MSASPDIEPRFEWRLWFGKEWTPCYHKNQGLALFIHNLFGPVRPIEPTKQQRREL